MQTFLPYESFIRSAQVLDYRRLGKQRVEAKQILQALHFGGTWVKHPAAKMWRGYERCLGVYWYTMCQEWCNRGYNDNLIHEAKRYLASMTLVTQEPPWLGCAKFHASHRSNLLRKDPVHYGKFGWKEHPHLPYVWPDANYVPLRAKTALPQGTGTAQ